MDIVRDSKKSKRKPLLIAGAVGVLVVGVIGIDDKNQVTRRMWLIKMRYFLQPLNKVI